MYDCIILLLYRCIRRLRCVGSAANSIDVSVCREECTMLTPSARCWLDQLMIVAFLLSATIRKPNYKFSDSNILLSCYSIILGGTYDLKAKLPILLLYCLVILLFHSSIGRLRFEGSRKSRVFFLQESPQAFLQIETSYCTETIDRFQPMWEDVCIYIYIYVYIYVYMYICVHGYICIYIHMYVKLHICINLCT